MPTLLYHQRLLFVYILLVSILVATASGCGSAVPDPTATIPLTMTEVSTDIPSAPTSVDPTVDQSPPTASSSDEPGGLEIPFEFVMTNLIETESDNGGITYSGDIWFRNTSGESVPAWDPIQKYHWMIFGSRSIINTNEGNSFDMIVDRSNFIDSGIPPVIPPNVWIGGKRGRAETNYDPIPIRQGFRIPEGSSPVSMTLLPGAYWGTVEEGHSPDVYTPIEVNLVSDAPTDDRALEKIGNLSDLDDLPHFSNDLVVTRPPILTVSQSADLDSIPRSKLVLHVSFENRGNADDTVIRTFKPGIYLIAEDQSLHWSGICETWSDITLGPGEQKDVEYCFYGPERYSLPGQQFLIGFFDSQEDASYLIEAKPE